MTRKSFWSGKSDTAGLCLLFLGLMPLVAAAEADTWYLNKSASTSAKYAVYLQPVTNGIYWTSKTTGEKGTTINATDTYVVANDYTLSINSSVSFAGKELVIGDLETEKYKNLLYCNGHVNVPNGTLVLARGYVTHGTASTSSYQFGCPIKVTAPKATPFGIRSSYHNTKNFSFLRELYGDASVGLVVGGHWTGSEISRMTATNVTFTLGSLDNYHGALTCVSSKAGPSQSAGNVMVQVAPSPEFAGTIELENGVRLSLTDVGELCADEMTLHDGAILRYASSSATTSVIRVAGKFEMPEAGGKVYLTFSSAMADSTAVRDFPLLVVPDTQTLDTNSFVIVGNDPEWPTGRLIVSEDATAKTKTLVWRVFGVRNLKTGDSTTFTTNGETLTSALSEGQEDQWNPAELPKAECVYAFGQKSNHGNCLRTIWKLAEDYVFPGEYIHAIGSQAILVMANNVGFDANIYNESDMFRIWVYNSMDPTLHGRVHLAKPALSRGYASTILTIASRLSGDGYWMIDGYGSTGSPNATTWFTGDNSEWKGRLIAQSRYSSGKGAPSESYRQVVGFATSESFGGRMDEMDYKALSLIDYSMLYITNDVTMAADLNRGLYVTNNAIVSVEANCTLGCNWPLTMNGTLLKKGNGQLTLGGAVRFIDETGAVVETLPEDASRRTLNIKGGAVKAMAHGCVDGLLIGGAAMKLALDFNPADADLKRYGFYNVKTDTPFVSGKAITLELQNVETATLAAARATDEGYKQGLITVKTEAADNVAANLAFTRVKGLKVIREDDAATGLTTFSAYGKKTGALVIVR